MALNVYTYNGNVQNATEHDTHNEAKQNQKFYLEMLARRTLDQSFNFSKFANIHDMMKQRSGDEFRTSIYYWSIYNDVVNDDGTYNASAENGYIADRTFDTIQTKINDMQLTSEGTTDKQSIYALGTYRKITFKKKMKKFAAIIELNEDAETYSEDAVRALAMENATMEMNLAYNDLMLTDILSSSFKVFGGDAASDSDLGGDDDTVATKYKLTKKLSVRVYGKLVKNKAKFMTELIKGQNRIGTTPIPKAFYIAVGADMYNAFIDESLYPDFVSREQYANPNDCVDIKGMEEIGKLGKFRILYSELMPKKPHKGHEVGDGSAASTTCHSSVASDGKYYYDVYPCITMAKDAISTIGLQGKTEQQMYVQFPEQVDGTNPIGEKGYIAYKFRYASVITRPEHLAIIDVVCPI